MRTRESQCGKKLDWSNRHAKGNLIGLFIQPSFRYLGPGLQDTRRHMSTIDCMPAVYLISYRLLTAAVEAVPVIGNNMPFHSTPCSRIRLLAHDTPSSHLSKSMISCEKKNESKNKIKICNPCIHGQLCWAMEYQVESVLACCPAAAMTTTSCRTARLNKETNRIICSERKLAEVVSCERHKVSIRQTPRCPETLVLLQ